MKDKQQIEMAGCLRRLFRQRYVIRSRNEKWFQLIIEYRKRLQEVADAFAVYIEINEALGVAYLRAESEEMEEKLSIRLSKSKILSPFATALLIHLRWTRMQFYLDPGANQIPLTSVGGLREFIEPFSRSKIDNQFERQFRRALEELLELQVLTETVGDDAFFEITSLCDLLLPADQIQELRTRSEAYFDKVNGGIMPTNDQEEKTDA
jgi:hypothetical protein